MVITCDDLIFNDFRMSDHGLISGNGSDGAIDDSVDMSLTPTSTVAFLGERPTSKFISQKYKTNPEVTVRFAKAYCNKTDDETFTENELRHLNRLLTGKRGYSWLKIIKNKTMETDYSYRARVSKIEYERLGYDVVGYDVTFECDGAHAYSEEQKITFNVTAGTPFYVFCNSDDLHNYTLPTITLTTDSGGTLTLTNRSDNFSSEISDMTSGETLTIDCQNELLSSSRTRTFILNDFNLHWPRLLPDKNEYTCSLDATITFTFRAARKVGFIS